MTFLVFHAQSSKAYPRVIQEVADYKQHVENFVVHLSGQSSPVAFRFYMRDNIPSYQVQETYGGPWVPVHGRSVWKRSEPDSNSNFSVILPPKQNPAAKSPRSPHPKKGEIISFIKNYISYIDELQKKTDPTCDIYLQDQCLVEYWRRISKILEKGWEETDGAELKEGFWPATNHGTGHKLVAESVNVANALNGQMRQEAEEEIQAREEIFVGNASERKLANFVPLIHTVAGLMLLLRPSDEFCCQDCLWVAKAIGPVCRYEGNLNFNKIPIQWW
ncbi:hypothetical protein R1sor_010356 [Riccia sorocarpa]|uniref:Uncharacterized protein n=1 Tax=Riccia sorocarpa TaxID=122646 RepID=A0ABD3I1C7_9MARC